MTVDAATILRRLSLFAGLSDEAVRAVAARTVSRAVRRNELLFRKGEPCRGLYVVVEGKVQVYRASPDGREQVLHVEGPGRPLAEVPVFDGGPYPASARALEDGRVLFLPIDEFQALYRSYPEIADAVIRDLGRRLRRMVALVEKVTLLDVPARVAATIVEAAEAAGAFRDGGAFVVPQTQEELARGLATTREGVARALARLRKQGIIAQEGAHIRILDAAALDAAARGAAPGGHGGRE
ncbi:MAG TPA: Crp/Fnr family transcriptional regulator [Longimicrobiales bacterium]